MVILMEGEEEEPAHVSNKISPAVVAYLDSKERNVLRSGFGDFLLANVVKVFPVHLPTVTREGGGTQLRWTTVSNWLFTLIRDQFRPYEAVVLVRGEK